MSAYNTSEFDSAPARISPQMLALIGERFAMSASSIQAQLDVGDASAQALARLDLGRLESLGVQLQQLARMLDLSDEAQEEKVDIALACKQACTDWHARSAAAGVDLQMRGESLKVALNAAAFELIIDLLIEYGVVLGKKIAISVAPNPPNRGGVRFEVTRRPLVEFDAAAAPLETDELFALLAILLARGTGFHMRRSDMGNMIVMVLSIPPSASEGFAVDDGELLPRTPVTHGMRILIVDPRSSSRLRAHQLLDAAGMLVDATENVAQAHIAWRHHEPDLLIIGMSAREREMVDLLDEIRSSLPALRVIELVDEQNAFAFAMPGSDAVGKLSRSEIDSHLVAAVSQELYASRGA